HEQEFHGDQGTLVIVPQFRKQVPQHECRSPKSSCETKLAHPVRNVRTFVIDFSPGLNSRMHSVAVKGACRPYRDWPGPRGGVCRRPTEIALGKVLPPGRAGSISRTRISRPDCRRRTNKAAPSRQQVARVKPVYAFTGIYCGQAKRG